MRRRVTCTRCDREVRGPIEARQLWHRCSVTEAEPPRPFRSRLETLHDERMSWASRALGGAIEDALGDRAFLDVDEEVAS